MLLSPSMLAIPQVRILSSIVCSGVPTWPVSKPMLTYDTDNAELGGKAPQETGKLPSF